MAAGELARLADAVRGGKVSATELVAEALRRMDALDGELNAVVARCDDAAEEAAAAVDAAVARGEDPGPLGGVPVLVKDLEDVAGMVTTQGSLLLADSPPASAHGTVPKRLVDAGAVIVGKSNLPEFATEGYTDNLVFGSHGQSVAARLLTGRFERGKCGGAGVRHGADRDGYRRRRIDPHPRSVLRAGRAEADARRHRALARPRLDRHVHRGAVRNVCRRPGVALARDVRTPRRRPGARCRSTMLDQVARVSEVRRVFAVGRMTSDAALPDGIASTVRDRGAQLSDVIGVPVQPVTARRTLR